MSHDSNARAQEALRLFAQIQAAGVFEDKADVAAKPRAAQGGASPRRAPSASRVRQTTPSRTEPHHKQVDDAVIAKLHKRNKELIAELESLKLRLASSEHNTGNSDAIVVGEHSKQHAQHSPESVLLRAETKLLKRQLEELRAANLRSIDAGEATGKVNRDVKAFFQATKQKIYDDAVQLEAERLAWNQALLTAESVAR
jgi:hypothetical protein